MYALYIRKSSCPWKLKVAIIPQICNRDVRLVTILEVTVGNDNNI